MVYTGMVRGGVIVLEGDVALPEGSRVTVQVAGSEVRTTLVARFANVVGKATGLPKDMASQHDHYLHGTPKR